MSWIAPKAEKAQVPAGDLSYLQSLAIRNNNMQRNGSFTDAKEVAGLIKTTSQEC